MSTRPQQPGCEEKHGGWDGSPSLVCVWDRTRRADVRWRMVPGRKTGTAGVSQEDGLRDNEGGSEGGRG
eukprot:scaffold350_cov333-Pavlova_lutheri.AAC.50